MNRIKTLRLARGYSQEMLVTQMGNIITKQALSKYERQQSTPSPSVAVQMAKALNVKTIELFTEPRYDVTFIAYRRNVRFGKRKQAQIEAALAEEMQKRLHVEAKLGLTTPWPLTSIPINNVAEVETAANQLRNQWHLGQQPIPNLMDLLEKQGIHILPVPEAPEQFHGIAALAQNEAGEVCGAGIAYANEAVGERQRLTLAHELGHLVMNVAEGVDEEKAAFRFAGAFLMPAAELLQLVGERRHTLSLNELALLKAHFRVSMQALVYRAKDLGIINQTSYRDLFHEISRRGWRKVEPNPIPHETPQLWKLRLLRGLSEKLITAENAAQWNVAITPPQEAPSSIDPRHWLHLSPAERQKRLQAQATAAHSLYEENASLQEWADADLGSESEAAW